MALGSTELEMLLLVTQTRTVLNYLTQESKRKTNKHYNNNNNEKKRKKKVNEQLKI